MNRLMIALLAVCVMSLVSQADGAEVREGKFDAGGVQLRYASMGDGPPLVLIHGYSDSVDWAWIGTGVMERLAEGRRVIALDCRGHGRSGKPHEPGVYGVEMVADVARLLDHLGVESAHIAGYSMGGRIALKFAAMHPERVRTLTLIAASGTVAGSEIDVIERTAESLERGEGIVPLVEMFWPREADGSAPSAETVRAVSDEVMAENDAEALRRVAREFSGLLVTAQEVGALGMPVFGVVGSDDPVAPATRALEGRVKSVQVRVLVGANHIDILERPELCDTIAAFLDRAGRDDPESPRRTPAGR